MWRHHTTGAASASTGRRTSTIPYRKELSCKPSPFETGGCRRRWPVPDGHALPHAAQNDVIVRVHAGGLTPGEVDWRTTWADRAGHDRRPSVPGHVPASGGVRAGGGRPGPRTAGDVDLRSLDREPGAREAGRLTRCSTFAPFVLVHAATRPRMSATAAQSRRLRTGDEPVGGDIARDLRESPGRSIFRDLAGRRAKT